MAEVPVILKLYAQKTGQVDAVLQATRKEFDALGGGLADIARTAAIGTGAITAGLVGIGAAAVNTAGQFEQLQAKLTSALGSSEKAARAFADTVAFAGETPFDVQGLVSATVTLEAFGQRSQQVLPLVANLAAAFGKSAEEAALTLGKALSGSLEGFESLRNTYGISNAQLAQYGARLTATGGIALKSAGDLDKARAALTAIIQTRFGDAVATQSKTLFGALSNLGDSISRTAAAFGSELIPSVTAVARAVTGFVEAFEALPGPIRQAIVVAGVLATGLGAIATVTLGVGAATIAAVAGLTAFAAAMGRAGVASAGAGAQVAAANTAIATTSVTSGAAAAAGFARIGVAITSAVGAVNAFLATRVVVTTAGMATAAGGLAAAFGVLTAAIGGAVTATLAFLATPIGLALAATAAVVAAVSSSFGELKRQSDIAKELDAQSRSLQKVRNDWDLYSSAVEKAAGASAGFLGSGHDVQVTVEKLSQALRQTSLLEFVAGLQRAGLSGEELKKVLADVKGESEKTTNEIRALSNVFVQLEKGGGSAEFLGNAKRDLPIVRKLLGDLPLTVDNVRAAFEELSGKQNQLGSLAKLLGVGTEKTDELSAAFEAASSRADALGAFIRTATQTNDVDSLSQSLGTLNAGIQQQAAQLGSVGIQTGDIAALRQRLLTANDAERAQIEKFLGLLQLRVNLEKTIADEKEAKVNRGIQQVIKAAEREKLLGNEQLQSEKAHLQEKLATVTAGSEGEMTILRRVAAIDETLRGRRVASAREGLDAALSAGKESVEALRANGEASAQQLANAYRTSIQSVQAFQNANKGVIAQSPELKKALESALGGLKKDLAAAEGAIPAEKLDVLLHTAQKFTAEAASAPEKLAGTQKALASLEAAANSGAITSAKERERLQDAIVKLRKDEKQLVDQVAEAEARQAKETGDLRKTTLEQQNEILKAQAAGGDKRAATQIKANEQELLRQRLDNIDAEAEAEKRSGLDAETIAQRKQLRITALTQEGVLERIRAGQDEAAATNKQVDDQLAAFARLHQLQANRVGGAASPLIGLEELGLQSTLPDFGGIAPGVGDRNGAAGFQSVPNPSQRIQRATAEVESALAQARSGRRTQIDERVAQPEPGTGAAARRGGDTTIHFNPNVKIGSPRLNDAVETVGKELAKETDRRGLVDGGGGPAGFA